MNRAAIALAVATGIAPQIWIDEGMEAMATAAQILKEQQQKR